MMSVTALFATAGATSSGLYPATGLCDHMASLGQFPPWLGRRFGTRLSAGLAITAVVAIALSAGFDLNSIASIGSAIALLVFTVVTAAHLRVRHETGAKTWVLSLAITTTVVVLAAFSFTTLPDEPGTAVALIVIVALSIVVDLVWKRVRDTRLRDRVAAADGNNEVGGP
jgi:amino acid transporter